MSCEQSRSTGYFRCFLVAIALSGVIFLRDLPADDQEMWSGSTSGALTAAPFEYIYRKHDGDFGVVLATEDRHLRILGAGKDGHGTVLAEVRTGIRFPQAVFSDMNGVIHLYGAQGERRLVGWAGDTLRVVDVSNPSLFSVPADAFVIVPDRLGNVYSLSSPGLVAYGSAAGYPLWTRELPSVIGSHTSDGDVLYVGLIDGSVFGFFSGGTGDRLVKLPASVERLWVSRENLWASDRDGMAYRLAASPRADRRAGSLQVEWTGPIQDAPPSVRSRISTAGGVTLEWSDGGLIRLNSENTLVFTDARGKIHSIIPLPYQAKDIRLLPRQRRVFVEYTEWRYTVIPLVSSFAEWSPDPPVLPGRLTRPETAGGGGRYGNGALAVYAEAVLGGASVSARRSLLEKLEQRFFRQDMYGKVTVVRSVLAALAAEPLQTGAVVDSPEIRRDAVRLLGWIGDAPSRRILSDVVRYDPDISVVAAALTAASVTGIDEPAVISPGLRRFQGTSGPERVPLATALLTAVDRMVSPGGGEDTDIYRQTLVVLASSDLPREIRQKALSAARNW
ncbi:MAG: hypothetical protein WCY01_01660 [Alkalispirochaeta sp.]